VSSHGRSPTEAIAEHLTELEQRAEFERGRKRKHRQLNEILNIVLGLLATGFAGAAGVTALEDVNAELVAALAGAATVLSATLAFLRLPDRAVFNRTLEAEFGRLARDAERLRDVELLLHAGDDAWIKSTPAKLEKYAERFAQLSQRAPLQE
jgi:hypothetical protein